MAFRKSDVITARPNLTVGQAATLEKPTPESSERLEHKPRRAFHNTLTSHWFEITRRKGAFSWIISDKHIGDLAAHLGA